MLSLVRSLRRISTKVSNLLLWSARFGPFGRFGSMEMGKGLIVAMALDHLQLQLVWLDSQPRNPLILLALDKGNAQVSVTPIQLL